MKEMTTEECPFCTETEDFCEAETGVGHIRHFCCTRPKDHEGPHVACGPDPCHDLYQWTNNMKETLSCEFCSHKEAVCGAEDDDFVCTREAGHDGPHIACATNPDHELHQWNNDASTTSTEPVSADN